MHIEEIGIVQNEVKDRMDADWGQVQSIIRLVSTYKGGFLGLESFSHAIIVSYLNQASFEPSKHLQRHPRNQKSMPLIGIFSQRGKNRPNSIGITTVEIVEVREEELVVKGLDTINGTPVLDIKPYYPHYDRIEAPVIPQWVETLMDGYF